MTHTHDPTTRPFGLSSPLSEITGWRLPRALRNDAYADLDRLLESRRPTPWTTSLREELAAAQAFERHLGDLEGRWKNRDGLKKEAVARRAVEVYADLREAVRLLHDELAGAARREAAGDTHPATVAAAALHRDTFARGLGSVVIQSRPKLRDEAGYLLRALQSDAAQPAAADPGLAFAASRLARASEDAEEVRTAQASRQTLSYGRLRRARAEARERMLHLVVRVAVADGQPAEQRDALLHPFATKIEAFRRGGSSSRRDEGDEGAAPEGEPVEAAADAAIETSVEPPADVRVDAAPRPASPAETPAEDERCPDVAAAR